jgi:hypothetical protein
MAFSILPSTLKFRDLEEVTNELAIICTQQFPLTVITIGLMTLSLYVGTAVCLDPLVRRAIKRNLSRDFRLLFFFYTKQPLLAQIGLLRKNFGFFSGIFLKLSYS